MWHQPVDEISARPRPVSPRLAWLLVVALAGALIATVTVTVHYRGEVTAVRQRLRPASRPAVPPAALLRMSSTTAALPYSRTLSGEVTAFAVRVSAGVARVLVTADIMGGQPHSRYELLGGDCVGNGPDRNWASGVANAAGTAELAGRAWTVSVSHRYYFVLNTPGTLDHPGPAVHGYPGAAHGLTPVSGGIAPCTPG